MSSGTMERVAIVANVIGKMTDRRPEHPTGCRSTASRRTVPPKNESMLRSSAPRRGRGPAHERSSVNLSTWSTDPADRIACNDESLNIAVYSLAGDPEALDLQDRAVSRGGRKGPRSSMAWVVLTVADATHRLRSIPPSEPRESRDDVDELDTPPHRSDRGTRPELRREPSDDAPAFSTTRPRGTGPLIRRGRRSRGIGPDARCVVSTPRSYSSRKPMSRDVDVIDASDDEQVPIIVEVAMSTVR